MTIMAASFITGKDSMLVSWMSLGGLRVSVTNLSRTTTPPTTRPRRRDAERWILEREGRLPTPATDGDPWIACSDQLPEAEERVQIIREGEYTGKGLWAFFGPVTYWRPRPVDPHAVAACLFDEDRPTLEQVRAATLHVAGCAECRAKLEAKVRLPGGAA